MATPTLLSLLHGLPARTLSGDFDSNCHAAFNFLKEQFTHAPVLTKWVPDAELVVETNTSDYMLATILSTQTSDGDLHPIAVYSHSFNSTELNYDTHDKELLAIFEGFKHWRQYLEGSRTLIDVVTDHNILPLQKSLLDAKPGGQSTFPNLIWSFTSTPKIRNQA